MWIFTDIADWWDNKNKEAHQALDQMVEDSDYNTGVMIFASTAHAFSVFGAGAVDILRLGDGVKQGTWGGVGHDALRAVAVFPVGKAVNLVKSARGVSAAKLVVDIYPRAGICAWVASAKALSHTGHRMANGRVYASVNDLAKAVGVPLSSIGPIPFSHMVMRLRQAGAVVEPAKRLTSMKQVKQMIPHDGSVLMVKVGASMKTGGDSAHAIYAYRQAGQIRIMDRTVTTTRKAYKTLEELVKSYDEVKNFFPLEAALLRNVVVKSVGFELPVLAIPVLGAIADNQENER